MLYVYSRLSRAVATKHKTTKVTNTSRLIVYPVIPMQLCVCVFIPPEVKLLVQQNEHNHGTNFQGACVGDADTNWLAMWVFCCGWITSPQGYRLNAWALIKECKTILYVHGNNWLVFAISLPGIELIQFKVSTCIWPRPLLQQYEWTCTVLPVLHVAEKCTPRAWSE